ncbi:MAG: Fe-S cluster assembly protein SufD [Opitutaceae bacterium]|jgi:Fe-S cluster assembly protein SufD|nr:Fe-S cluster assembly protein SufD [Opitutaceae bacterium]
MSANETYISKRLFQRHLDSVGRARLPEWWLDTQRAAWDAHLGLPHPGPTDETWRFTDTEAIRLSGFEPFPTADLLGALPAGQLRAPAPVKPPPGVVYCTLNEAIAKHADLFRAYFRARPAALGGEKFAELNAAFAACGAFLYVPDGVELTTPLFARHVLNGHNIAAFPHTLVILGKNASATLVEVFDTEYGDRLLASGVSDLHAASGARLTYIGIQNWGRQATAFHSNATSVAQDANVTTLNLHLGARYARHESHTRLDAPGGRAEILALTHADANRRLDQRTLQTHSAPDTYSNLLYKNALRDTSKTVFSGLINVEPDAQRTDAYQSNRNLLLSPDAEANSLPGLEIQANDVRCTHGATTGGIDPEQAYYMAARGIPPETANALLVEGFFEEVLGKIPERPRAPVEATLRAALARGGR